MSPVRKGFSLVLSLTVMAMLVLTIITIAAFISVEARLTMQHQLGTRARLNALASLRLAMGHLQQEAGPDRRSTARADLTQFGVPASQLRNPMWTGVWRTDKPDEPPAWLISGRADRPAGSQSVTLRGESEYLDDHWAPWQIDYAPPDEERVKLVGLGSATDLERVAPVSGDSFNYDKPSGLVYLPPVPMPDADTGGRYAYWVGDDGVKARINLLEKRTVEQANTIGNITALRSPVRAGYELLPGLESLSAPEDLAALTSVNGLPHLSGFGTGTTDPSVRPPNARRIFHDVSLSSSGVLADSLHGGLKRDLSLVFELNDNDFARTEFGSGFPEAAATMATDEVDGHNTVSIKIMGIPYGGNTADVVPVFNRKVPAGNIRGPTWWALRNFYRLHKELGWLNVAQSTSAGPADFSQSAAPTIIARTLYPNSQKMNPTPGGGQSNNVRQRIYTYSDVFNGDQTSPLNPNVVDSGTIYSVNYRPVPRPVAVAVTPYVNRISLVFGVTREVTTVKVRGQPTSVNVLHLTATPVVVLHNPFNVAIKCDSPDRGNTDKYSMGVSFSDMDLWTLNFTRNGVPATQGSYNISLGSVMLNQGNNSSQNEADMIRAYLPPEFTLQPGEYKVFSAPTLSNGGHIAELTDGLNSQGGISLPSSLNWPSPAGDNLSDSETVSFNITPFKSYRIRHALACWPGDQLKKNSFNTDALYFKTSEQSEFYYREPFPISSSSSGATGNLMTSIPLKVDPLTAQNGIPLPAVIVEMGVKTANWTDSPFPIFTHSNPMAASLRADGAGRSASGANMGIGGAAPSLRAGRRHPTGWNDIAATNSNAAFGGFSTDSNGTTKSVHLEVPLAPSTSLAQLGDAQFGVRDQQPAFGLGNSFASTLVDSRKSFQDNGPDWTEFDQPYLLNSGLWDAFYLSGAGPVMTRKPAPWDTLEPDVVRPASNNSPGQNPPYEEDRPLSLPATPDDDVLDDFIAGKSTLGNPRLRLLETSLTPQDARVALGDYRRSASVLMNDGAFNVNSTSVEAWATLLGSVKKLAVTQLQPNSPSSDANARFPRFLPHGTTAVSQGQMNDGSNWHGLCSLTDSQIHRLALAIVEENKYRATLSSRTEREAIYAPKPRLFRGKSLPGTPYLGLSEFINRFLNQDSWAGRCGTIQAAIFRADAQHSANLSDRLSSGGSGLLEISNLTHTTNPSDPNYRKGISFASNPENGVITPAPAVGISGATSNRTHTALGAPGNLLQGDILKVIGPALTARSDTFTIRAYGDATDASGAVARGLLEAVAQRIPEFVDDADPPEAGSAAEKPSKVVSSAGSQTGEPALWKGLTPANRLFGRKFKIISIRWVRPDEA